MTATDPEAREAMRAQIVEAAEAHLPCYDYRGLVCGCACDDRGCESGWQAWCAHLADVLLGLWDGDES